MLFSYSNLWKLSFSVKSNQIQHSSRERREKEAVDEDRKEVQRHVDSMHQGVIEFPSCAGESTCSISSCKTQRAKQDPGKTKVTSCVSEAKTW